MNTSILHMYFAQDANEAIREAQMKTLPPTTHTEPIHYWFIYRKSKSKFPRKGTGRWVFVRAFTGTKADIANFWNKYFRDGNHRLKHLIDYSKKPTERKS